MIAPEECLAADRRQSTPESGGRPDDKARDERPACGTWRLILPAPRGTGQVSPVVGVSWFCFVGSRITQERSTKSHQVALTKTLRVASWIVFHGWNSRHLLLEWPRTT